MNSPSSVATRPVSYGDLDTALTGVLHWDDTRPAPRPGILLVHGGAGLDEHAREQASRYAALGYTVLACDMFGDGVAGDRDRIVACVTALRDDPAMLARRGRAGLTALANCPETVGRPAAIGFCFGGLAALTLARSGADLAAAISIHGTLKTTAPAEPGAVTARILVCHGACDPHVPMAHVLTFATEMNHANADWQLVVYGQAQHGFTHRHATNHIPGVSYNPAADTRSFTATTTLLAEVLTTP